MDVSATWRRQPVVAAWAVSIGSAVGHRYSPPTVRSVHSQRAVVASSLSPQQMEAVLAVVFAAAWSAALAAVAEDSRVVVVGAWHPLAARVRHLDVAVAVDSTDVLRMVVCLKYAILFFHMSSNSLEYDVSGIDPCAAILNSASIAFAASFFFAALELSFGFRFRLAPPASTPAVAAVGGRSMAAIID
jgi:hypothetical protein